MSNQHPGDYPVELTRDIQAPAEAVYDAFTKPALLSQWFTTTAQVDLRVGGRYRNGDDDEGAFLLLDPPRHLRFTWENPDHCPGTVVDIDILPLDPGTVRVMLVHQGIATREGSLDMEGGWSWALDSLRSFLELGKPIPHSEWERSGIDA